MDRISDLPDCIVEKILCSLPLLDAVKTSVLARGWRRHRRFTRTKLIFDARFWEATQKHDEAELSNFVTLVNTLLSKHTGILDALCIWIPLELWEEAEALSPCIEYALRKGVKALTLRPCPVDLPDCIYSSAQLTHLTLEHVSPDFSPPESFDGLQNLVSLKLGSRDDLCREYTQDIMNFINSLPKIKRVSLVIKAWENLIFHSPTLEYVKFVGICWCIYFPEAGNVKKLVVDLFESDCCKLMEECQMMRFFSGMVKLETLKLRFGIFEILVSCGVPGTLSTTLEQLKTAELELLHCCRSTQLCGLLCLLSSSPKLGKLNIDTPYEATCVVDEELKEDIKSFETSIDLYRGHRFESIHTVKIGTDGGVWNIMLIDLLLSCCTNLETMFIYCDARTIVDVLKKVNALARASPKAKVVFL